jgi:hypothetical protein
LHWPVFELHVKLLRSDPPGTGVNVVPVDWADANWKPMAATAAIAQAVHLFMTYLLG